MKSCRWIAVWVVLFGAPSCALFQEPQLVVPTEWVTELEAKWGQDFDGMRADLSKKLGAHVIEIKALNGEIVATLSAPIEEMAAKGGESFLDRVGNEPGIAGAGAGMLAAIFAAIKAWQNRKTIAAKFKKPKTKPE